MTATLTPPQRPAPAALPVAGGRRRFASARAIGALMLREMATTYGRTPGGYLWAILEPVLGIAILTFAFSFFFRQPPIGTSFALFYATGVLPLQLFMTINNRVGSALIFSRPLLVYPAVTYVDALVARFVVTALTGVLTFYLIAGAMLMMLDLRVVLDMRQIFASLALASFLGFGMGVLNAYLFLRFNIWQVLWQIVSRPLFLISGVIFIYDQLPATLRDILWYNPLIHVVGQLRKGFYASYSGAYVEPLYVVGVSLVCLVLGLRLLSWHAATLIHES